MLDNLRGLEDLDPNQLNTVRDLIKAAIDNPADWAELKERKFGDSRLEKLVERGTGSDEGIHSRCNTD